MPKLRVIDFETTGLGPESLVCEQGWRDVIGDETGWRVGPGGSMLHEVEAMPPEVRAIHHISALDTQGCPPFDPEEMWARAKADGVDVIAAHNASFEAQFWGAQQLPVICTLKVAAQLWLTEAPSHGNGTRRGSAGYGMKSRTCARRSLNSRTPPMTPGDAPSFHET